MSKKRRACVAGVLGCALMGCGAGAPEPGPFRTVSFPSEDGLTVTADFYEGADSGAPTLVAFHQSASSRGEFRTLGPPLAALGYHVLAVDLRWGRVRRGVLNETAARFGTDEIMAAVEAGAASPWPTIDASLQDMRAALAWLGEAGLSGPRFALGSSFSAALVYALGAEGRVDGVIAYSPGEYDDERPEMVRAWARELTVPALSVAAPGEDELVRPIAEAVGAGGSRYAVAEAGQHGASLLDVDPASRALLGEFLAHHTGGPPIRAEVEVAGPGGLPIVADRYDGPGTDRVAVLFHQGGGSARGEYGFLVPRLLGMGFDVVAADLHGGGDRFGRPNRTMARAPQPETFGYCDALPQVEAVLAHARAWRPAAAVTAWGSSYSGALVLHAATRSPDEIDRVLAFSPASGEPMRGCAADDTAEALGLPTLIVRPSSETGIESVARQLATFQAAGVDTYVAEPGAHGSSTLNPFRVSGDVRPAWARVRAFLTDAREPGGGSDAPGS